MPTAENTPLPRTLSARDSKAALARRAATDADDRLDQAMRQTDHVTAVEVDAVAKAQARADEENELRTDPSVPALGAVPPVGDATETNLLIVPEAEGSSVTPPPQRVPGAASGAASGDEPSLGKPVTLELAAQTVLSDGAALMRISDEMAAQRPADDGGRPRTTHEMTAQDSIEEMQSGRPRTTFEMAAQTTIGASDPLAGDSIPPRGSLSAELAAQQADGEGGDLTDPSRRGDTDVSRRVGDIEARRDVLGGARDYTPIPTKEPRKATLSTAPTGLKPPRPTEVATSGPTPACPQCESPMAWVEEHLRFYCKQCRMYF